MLEHNSPEKPWNRWFNIHLSHQRALGGSNFISVHKSSKKELTAHVQVCLTMPDNVAWMVGVIWNNNMFIIMLFIILGMANRTAFLLVRFYWYTPFSMAGKYSTNTRVLRGYPLRVKLILIYRNFRFLLPLWFISYRFPFKFAVSCSDSRTDSPSRFSFRLPNN